VEKKLEAEKKNGSEILFQKKPQKMYKKQQKKFQKRNRKRKSIFIPVLYY